MDVFAHDGKMILVANNEYTNRRILSVSGENRLEDQDEIAKGMMAHGVSVMEIAEVDGAWQVVRDSPYNRRITPQTDMALTGPAAGHDLMKTAADATGTTSKGTWNNCGNGMTPWGTYLACEENFNGYFSTEDEAHEVSPELQRYGVSARDWGYSWARIDDRFDVAKNPNEPNRAGYVVEIDPTDPTSTPRKLTALGRFKHENAEAVVNNDGRIVVYMGDDERGEFMYRFVSEGVYAPGADTNALLEKGTLSVAKFHDNGTRRMAGADAGNHRHGIAGRDLHPHPSGWLGRGRDHHGPSGVDHRQPEQGRGVLRADQQQEPGRQDQCRRRRDPGGRSEPARGQQIRPDRALAA